VFLAPCSPSCVATAGLQRDAGPDSGATLEIFYRDDTDYWTFSAEHVADLPLELIEAFIAEARRRLAPGDDRP